MDTVDKLSCKEELNESDMDAEEHKELGEPTPQKKRRRKREVEMIKLSDEEDSDEDGSKKSQRFNSPGPNSPASHRNPRTCVLKASQKRKPLSRLLEQLLRNLEKRDPHQFFAWPVNDNFAPNYSRIIKRPMDFCTMKQKIDDNAYRSLNCFINDFKLMCNNAMKYNKTGTVYHKAARKLLHAGLKQLTPQKLRPLGNMLTYMYEIPIRELGFDIGKMDLKVKRGSSPLKSGGSETEETREERIVVPEAGKRAKLMARARDKHRQRLAKKAFPRMDAEGKTTLCLVTGNHSNEKPMTLGQYIGKLTQGTGTLHTLREDRRNIVKGVKALNYGPFGSYAPSYDGTFASLTKDESHLLYHTLPSELGEGSESLLRFASDSPWSVLYDMEDLFPQKKPITEQVVPVQDNQQDLSKVNVDIESLRSLSELGFDVEFLNDIEEDIVQSQHDYGISKALAQTGEMLDKLQREQVKRLSAPLPAHLSLLPTPSIEERESAGLVSNGLKAMATVVGPRHVVSVRSIREAMGVTLQHLETPMPPPPDHELVGLETLE